MRKNWQHCYQGCGLDRNTYQIAIFLVPSDSFWPMNRGWCHLRHFWVEAWKARVWLSSLSLSCPRSFVFQMGDVQEPHWSQTSIGCVEYTCVLLLRFEVHLFQQQSRAYSDGYRGERRLEKKTESVTWSRYFPGSPLPSVSSSQAAPSGLTFLPLLDLVISQPPFLFCQQLDLSLV